MNIQELQTQFAGRRFGELVLHHCKQQDQIELAKALLGSIQGLSAMQKETVDTLTRSYNESALAASFWQQDCGEVLRRTAAAATEALARNGVKPSDDELFDVFNTIVLQFAFATQKDSRAKRYAQDAVGVGFFGRLFGG